MNINKFINELLLIDSPTKMESILINEMVKIQDNVIKEKYNYELQKYFNNLAKICIFIKENDNIIKIKMYLREYV